MGNTLGSHLETDFSYLQTGVCCIGRVLVLLDFRNGLPTELVIKKVAVNLVSLWIILEYLLGVIDGMGLIIC